MLDGLGRVLLNVLQETQRSVESAGFVQQQLDAQIHLQKGEALVHPHFECSAHVCSSVLPSTSVSQYIRTLSRKFSPQQLIEGDAVGLSRQIPQSNFNAGDAAALTGMAAKLLNPPEELIHVAGIFPQQTALEHEGIGAAGSVPHLAVAYDPLIGIDLQERAVLGSAVDVSDPDVGNFQLGGMGTGADGEFQRNFSAIGIPPLTLDQISLKI